MMPAKSPEARADGQLRAGRGWRIAVRIGAGAGTTAAGGAGARRGAAGVVVANTGGGATSATGAAVVVSLSARSLS